MKKGLKFKLLSIFGALLLIIALNGIWAIINFQRLNNSIDNIMKQNYDSILYAQQMIYALDNQNNLIVNYLYVNGNNIDNNLRSNETNFLSLLALAYNNITEPGEKDTLDSIRADYNSYITQYNEILQNTNVSISEKDTMFENLQTDYKNTSDGCKALLDLNQEGMMKRKNNAYLVAQNATIYTSVISGVTVLIGIIVSLLLTDKIIKPLKNLIDKIKKIAQGDYSQELNLTGNDEFAQLGIEYNKMTKQLLSYKNINIKKMVMEKQKAEAIVESITDGIIVTDDEHKIVLVNHAAEKALNILEDEVLNLHFLEGIKHEQIFEMIKNYKTGPNIGGKLSEDITITINNEVSHYRVYVKPIRTKNHESLGVVTLLQNITKLKEVDKIKSDFISTVSHEFRTPLTSITMASGLLADEVPGPVNQDQKELIGVIKEDSQRLNNLVTDLLDFSKIESGKVQMDIISCDVNDIISHAVKPFEMQIKEKNVKLITHPNEHLAKVKADYNKIIWIITNLIGNALRYVNKDSGIIDIDALQTATKMLVTVKDNGSGIPEEYLDKIFGKFVQVDNDMKKGSAGLGLAICKEIIKAHGGDIWVESKINEGSAFFFTLNLSV